MPLQIYKRGRFYWVKGWVEYNAGQSQAHTGEALRHSTEAGARDWVTLETELQIRRHVVGDEISKTFQMRSCSTMPPKKTLSDSFQLTTARQAEPRERTPADKEWIEAFCSAADPYNAALVRFMFETAARIDQAVSLEPHDLRPAENKVRVKAQKGHPESWITVSPEMMDELLALPPKRPRTARPVNSEAARFWLWQLDRIQHTLEDHLQAGWYPIPIRAPSRASWVSSLN
ncbi:Hypothetical protein FKW44_004907 [Caligus rogercresseyi]|uniref:Tyr recombinase domain-containing protein n=1 Tax=Caligus rogercresseyi TaxID=217165 RepID=A0A7T8HMT2_CALRO|nr:Hypothetical protein FKW44_004907 [Caligus rogercresseyi]